MVCFLMEKSFADIDSLRNRLGIAQAEMCREADVSESTLSRARSDQREPSPRIRRKLIMALERIAASRGVMVVDQPEDDGGVR